MVIALTLIAAAYAAIGGLLWHFDHRARRRGGYYALLGMSGAWASTCGVLLGIGWLIVLGVIVAGPITAIAIHRARTRPGAN